MTTFAASTRFAPDALNFYSFKAKRDFPVDRSQRGNSFASARVARPVLLSTTSGVQATEGSMMRPCSRFVREFPKMF